MNARRLEHLASLDLPLSGRDVLEVGAGVGDLTSFFLDRGCSVTAIEPRPENLAYFAAQYDEAGFWPANRLRILRGDAWRLAVHGEVAPHPVLFCYGLLYHLDRPLDALREMAASCTDLLVLETRVSYASDERLEIEEEDAAHPTNAVFGRGCEPSRRWVYARLSELFSHVYMPLTQPAHPQFHLDWRRPEPPPGRHRAIFVASRRELENSVLHPGVPDLQFAELPQLGALADPTDMTVVAARTIFGPFACFADDLINGQLLAFGAHTRNELAMLLAFVEAGDVVYDIGAHIGTFAVPLAAAVGQAGRLVAVEADADNYDRLLRNLASHGLLSASGPAHAVHAVIGGAGRFAAQKVAGNTGETWFKSEPAAKSARSSLSLDELHAAQGCGRVDVVKIDIEGMELAALRAAHELLAQRPLLYLEVSTEHLARHGGAPSELEALLCDKGYRFFRNVGERNSGHDRFIMHALDSLAEGGSFFDVLAIPEGHARLARANNLARSAAAQPIPFVADGPPRVPQPAESLTRYPSPSD
jgi:FkbM family methyltransferase